MNNNYIRKLGLVTGLTFGLCLLDRFMIGYMAPGFMPELGLNYTQLGMIVMIARIGAALGAWIFAPLTEYYGRRKGTVWANLAQTLISGATGLVRSFIFWQNTWIHSGSNRMAYGYFRHCGFRYTSLGSLFVRQDRS